MNRIFSFDRPAKARSRRAGARLACESLESRNLLSGTYSVGGLTLSEGLMDAYGSPDSNRYFEVQGPASTAIGDVELVVIDGYGNGSPTGTIDYALNLKGDVLGSNGLLMVEGSSGLSRYSTQSTVIRDSNFTDSVSTGGTKFLALINYSNTSGATPIPVNTELDPDNTGTINLTSGPAAGAFIQDGFEFVYDSTPDSTDIAYTVVENIGVTGDGSITKITVTAPSSDFTLFVGTVTPDAATRETAGTMWTTNTPPSSTTATVNFTPSNYWTYGYISYGTLTYQVGTPDVVSIATTSTITDPALTPGGLNNLAVAAFDPNDTFAVVEGNTLTIKIDLVNGTKTSNGSAAEVTYKAADVTTVYGTNYTIATGQTATETFSSDVITLTITTKNTGQSGDLFFALAMTAGNVYLASPQAQIIDIQA
jgi:hypothetical protein